MRSVAVTLTFLLCAGCGKDTQIAQRVEAWERQIAAEIPEGTSRAELNRWASAHGFEPVKAKEREFAAVVETIKSGGPVCSEWRILVSVTIARDRVGRSKVSQAGNCL